LISYGLARVDLIPVCLLLFASTPLCAQNLSDIVRNMERADSERLALLPQYSDLRRYTFSNERLKKSSEMLVRSKHQVGQGTEFVVLSSQGTEGVTGRIFRHVMDAERDASARGENRIDSTNYNFELLGTESINGRDCYKLKLIPKKRNKFLLDGTAWVDREDFGFVRIAGQPSASVSFWVGRPVITIDFEKVGQLWLVARNTSLAQARFLGRSELTIEYSGYTLANGTDVATRRYASR
jgi:hypothetical protein